MIQLDLIKWISAILRNEADQLTDYSIEYATALLMNLSLRDAGKDKCEEPDIELLNVLNDLVEHENLQVRTYVNGTLYSIFTRKKLREEAKELGMPEVLQYLMEQSDEQFKRQIQYILEQLNNNNEPDGEKDQSINANEGDDDVDDEDEDDEEDDDEEEIFDAEDAEFNDVIDEQGIMIGEDLLVNDFEAAEQDAKMQLQKVVALMEKDQR
jgi:LisH domain-containing protein ARMC9